MRADTHPDTRCRNCHRPLSAHGGHDNPARPFACPGLYDRRLAKFWAERTTSFKEWL